MELGEALDMARQALLVTLIVCGPVLAVGLLIGLFVSIIQTVTQVQDQTISLVPKIVAMFAAAAFFGSWLAQRMLEYSRQMFAVW